MGTNTRFITGIVLAWLSLGAVAMMAVARPRTAVPYRPPALTNPTVTHGLELAWSAFSHDPTTGVPREEEAEKRTATGGRVDVEGGATSENTIATSTVAEEETGEQPGVHGSPSTVAPSFTYEGALSASQKRRERNRIGACLSQFPALLRAPLQTVTVKAGRGNPRALSDGHHIVVHSVPLSHRELCNVVAHEMGHIIDIGLMQGTGYKESSFRDGGIPVLSDDMSVAYYELSWVNAKQVRTDADPLHFVSVYARQDSFEDFAESVELYVRNGRYFRSLLSTSNTLRIKYEFLRDMVFLGKEFTTGQEATDPTVRHYDSTLIGVRYH